MSGAIYSPARRNRRTARHRRTARQTPQTKTPHSTQKSEPPREKGEPLTCSPYKQSGGSSGFSPCRPAFSLQREYLSVVAQGGPRGGSWSGLPWLSYTSRGREPKIRFFTSSPQRASWCLESRLTRHHVITPSGYPHAAMFISVVNHNVVTALLLTSNLDFLDCCYFTNR